MNDPLDQRLLAWGRAARRDFVDVQSGDAIAIRRAIEAAPMPRDLLAVLYIHYVMRPKLELRVSALCDRIGRPRGGTAGMSRVEYRRLLDRAHGFLLARLDEQKRAA